MPSPPPSPPYLPIILPQSSPAATVTPPIMCSHSRQRKPCSSICVSGRALLLTRGSTDAVCDRDGRLRGSRGGFCCVRVLMEVMCSPSQAWRWTKGCLLWVTYWTCANAIRPHKTAGRNFTFGSKQQRMFRFISFCWRLPDPPCVYIELRSVLQMTLTGCIHHIARVSYHRLEGCAV